MSTNNYIFNGGIIMGKNHGNKNKEVQETKKEVIEATVTPEETETEDTVTVTKDNNVEDAPPKKDDEEPKKEPSLIRKATDKVKGGVKKVLGKQFTIGQVLGLVAGIGAAVFIGKTIYERGQQDALETIGGDADDDENLLEVHNDEVSYSEGGDDVYDEESETEEVEVSEDGDDEEVYDEEEVSEEENMIE